MLRHFFFVTVDLKYSAFENGTLKIIRLAAIHNGTFEVAVTNTFGTTHYYPEISKQHNYYVDFHLYTGCSFIAVRYPSTSVKQTDDGNCGKYIKCSDCKSKHVPSASVYCTYGRSIIILLVCTVLCTIFHWVYYVFTAIRKRSYRSRRDVNPSYLCDPSNPRCKNLISDLYMSSQYPVCRAVSSSHC